MREGLRSAHTCHRRHRRRSPAAQPAARGAGPAMEPPPPQPDLFMLHGMMPEIPLLRVGMLRTADRQQQQLMHTVMQHRQRQVAYVQRQAAAAAEMAVALPLHEAQRLQRDAFEQYWQQLDAAWQQARTAELEGWGHMRERQVGVLYT